MSEMLTPELKYQLNKQRLETIRAEMAQATLAERTNTATTPNLLQMARQWLTSKPAAQPVLTLENTQPSMSTR